MLGYLQFLATRMGNSTGVAEQPVTRLQALEEGVGVGDAREEFFFCLEVGRVHASAAAAQPDGMLQVEHLVVDDVFQHKARDAGMIKDTADDDGIVRRVVVSEDTAGFVLAPTHAWTTHEAMEKTRVQFFEDSVEIIDMAARRAQEFASSHLAHQMRLADDFVAADVLAIARRVGAVDWAAIHLREQDVSDRFQHGFGRAFEQVGETDEQASIAQANGVIEIGEGEELDLEFGQGSARTKFAVSFLEDFEKTGTHGEARLASLGPRQ